MSVSPDAVTQHGRAQPKTPVGGIKLRPSSAARPTEVVRALRACAEDVRLPRLFGAVGRRRAAAAPERGGEAVHELDTGLLASRHGRLEVA